LLNKILKYHGKCSVNALEQHVALGDAAALRSRRNRPIDAYKLKSFDFCFLKALKPIENQKKSFQWRVKIIRRIKNIFAT